MSKLVDSAAKSGESDAIRDDSLQALIDAGKLHIRFEATTSRCCTSAGCDHLAVLAVPLYSRQSYRDNPELCLPCAFKYAKEHNLWNYEAERTLSN